MLLSTQDDTQQMYRTIQMAALMFVVGLVLGVVIKNQINNGMAVTVFEQSVVATNPVSVVGD